MNQFVDTINKRSNKTVTWNNMPALVSTKNACVDFFYNAAALRGRPNEFLKYFQKALDEDTDIALGILLWSRDVRGGAGERTNYRETLKYFASLDLSEASESTFYPLIMKATIELGRFDDLLIFDANSTAEAYAFRAIRDALHEENGLCAKWMPRKGPIAERLRKFLKLTPKSYRRLLVRLTKVVEQDMCKNNWSEIQYDHVPSVAHSKYRTAFYRHDEERFSAYLDDVSSGVKKINASAIFPHDVLKPLLKSRGTVTSAVVKAVQAQWDALPDFMNGSNRHILPLIDTSGSMCWGHRDPVPMDVAVSLGLYVAEKNPGAFKDTWMTFSSESKLMRIENASIAKRVRSVYGNNEWGGSTNLEAAFENILNHARQNKVPAKDMPDTILIMSDMQFNQCVHRSDKKAISMIKMQYKHSGYTMPRIVFWNLNSAGNVPVKFDKSGTALVSGFSPSILRFLLQDVKELTPLNMMMRTIGNERYNIWSYI